MSQTFVGLATLVLLGAAAGQARAGYTYTRIAGTDDPTFFFSAGAPVISADGTVFFAGVHAGLSAIFQGNGGSVTPFLAASSGLNEFNQLAVNRQGTVAFEAFRSSDGRRGIFTYDGSNLTTIADTRGSFFSVGGPQINDAGTVAFKASFDPQGSRQAVYTGNGGLLTQIATSDSPLSSFSFAPLPSINNEGLVAFSSTLNGGGWGIFTGTGGSLAPLYDTNSNGFLLTLGAPDLNDAGQVVFLAGTTSGEGIFVGDGGPLTTVADTSQDYHFFFSGPGPSINNNGEVVFLAETLAGADGIFTGPDPVADKVIQVGDELFGGQVVGLGLGRGLDDNGQIAFIARVQQGSNIFEYIVRADPAVAPVPEPSSLILLGFGALGLLGYGWRRRLAASEAV